MNKSIYILFAVVVVIIAFVIGYFIDPNTSTDEVTSLKSEITTLENKNEALENQVLQLQLRVEELMPEDETPDDPVEPELLSENEALELLLASECGMLSPDTDFESLPGDQGLWRTCVSEEDNSWVLKQEGCLGTCSIATSGGEITVEPSQCANLLTEGECTIDADCEQYQTTCASKRVCINTSCVPSYE